MIAIDDTDTESDEDAPLAKRRFQPFPLSLPDIKIDNSPAPQRSISSFSNSSLSALSSTSDIIPATTGKRNVRNVEKRDEIAFQWLLRQFRRSDPQHGLMTFLESVQSKVGHFSSRSLVMPDGCRTLRGIGKACITSIDRFLRGRFLTFCLSRRVASHSLLGSGRQGRAESTVVLWDTPSVHVV